MAKKRKTTVKEKKGKKKWFSVLAPAILNQKELPDIIAFEPKDLVGRKLEISLKEFTANPKDSFKRIICKIVKVQGDTAHTEASNFFVTDSYVQRVAKRAKARVIVVQNIKTKDDKTAKIKSCILISNQVNREIKTQITKFIQDIVAREISKKTSQEIFSPKFISMLFADKKQISRIYPIQKMFIWKIILTE